MAVITNAIAGPARTPKITVENYDDGSALGVSVEYLGIRVLIGTQLTDDLDAERPGVYVFIDGLEAHVRLNDNNLTD